MQRHSCSSKTGVFVQQQGPTLLSVPSSSIIFWSTSFCLEGSMPCGEMRDGEPHMSGQSTPAN